MPATMVLLAAVLRAHPADGAAVHRLFVANAGDDTVSVVDTDSDHEVQTIPASGTPQALALRTTEPLLAVAAHQESVVRLIDPIALTAVGDPLPVGRGPEDVEFAGGGRLLCTTSYIDRTVSCFDVASRTIVGAPLAFAKAPRRLLASPDGTHLFVLVHAEDGVVALVDLAQMAVVTTAPVGPFPSDLALGHDQRTLLVSSFDAGRVTALDAQSLAKTASYDVDTGFGLVAHPHRPILYSMLSFEGEVAVFDYAKRERVATITVGPGPTHSVITDDGRYLYVVNNDANNVVKVDTTTNTALLRIAVGVDPSDAALLAVDAPGLKAAVLGTLAAVVVAALLAAWRRLR